jgi:ribosomal-protein-alanine N-acetyltransferase
MIEAAPPTASELLASLHARAFPKPWSASEIVKLMENQAVFALLHGNGAEPNGFVMAWAAAGDAELLTIAVVPEARRKGVGGAASMHLEVAENNEAARALYRKLGYEEAGRRHAYYAGEGGSVDAIVMRRALPRPVV